MTFCSEDKTEFCSEMYIDCPSSINSSNSLSLPIKLFAQLPPLKDHPRTVHHKVIYSEFGILNVVNIHYKYVNVL